MLRRNSIILVLSWTIVAIYHKDVEAGPMKRLTRMTREVYPEIDPESEGSQAQVCIVGDVVYGVDETVPAEQPCLKCRCQPPGVQCETIRCTKKPGCKAIHKSNKCCPDYQCECEVNGKTYANGERLETPPGGECKVCYCRGGEVQCAEVSCYIRNDCEGKRVPGKCCPKYDHCPPIDALPDRFINATDITLSNIEEQIFENWPITGQPPNISNNLQDDNKIPFEEVTSINKLPKTTEIEIDNLQIDDKPLTRITIHEIIPDIKEIPITAPPKLEEPPLIEKQPEVTQQQQNTSNELLVDAEADSSEILEVFHQPPPVLRVGDKLIYLKKGQFGEDESTPSSVITIIGAEGLQRGGLDESSEIVQERIVTPTNSSKTNLFKTAQERIVTPNNSSKNNLFDNTETNDLELKTSQSTHILSLVKKKKPAVAAATTTTEIITTEDTITVETSTVEVTTTSNVSEETTEGSPTEKLETTTNEITSSEIPSSTQPEETITVSATERPQKNYEATSEANPAYPSIPDVMAANVDDTSQRFDTDKSNETRRVDTKIFQEVLEIRSNKTIPQNVSHSEWLKNDDTKVEDSLINYKATLPQDLLNQPAPTDDEENTEKQVETTTEIGEITTETNQDRSVETMEEKSKEDSGEITTEKSSHAAVLSNENASIENSDTETEVTDMLSVTQEVLDSSTENLESTTNPTPFPVEMIDNISDQKINVTITTPQEKDVEIINTKSTAETLKTSQTAETLPKPEKLVISKAIGKRENSPIAESDQVFKQLDEELNTENTQRIQSREEEALESDAIFRELLEETSTKKVPVPQERNKETEALQRVSDALAKLTLRGKQPDSSILGILSNFFSSQYRNYDNK